MSRTSPVAAAPRAARAVIPAPLLALAVAGGLAACASGPDAAPEGREPVAVGLVEAAAHLHGAGPDCPLPPFALSVAELPGGFLGVALVSPDGRPVLAGEWSAAERRFRPDTLTFLERFAVELATAPEGTYDFTEELAPAVVAELADLGGDAHREALVAAFEGDARAAAQELALAGAAIGSLLARAPVVRDLLGEDGGACGEGRGLFPRACAEHATCYALSVEAGGPSRAECDAKLLDALNAEATFASEPFVALVHGAARAYGWRAWPDAGR